MSIVYTNPTIITTSNKVNQRSIKVEILSKLLINADNDMQTRSKELIKLFIFELQNLLLIIEIGYLNILCKDINMNIYSSSINLFPYKLCLILNFGFILQYNDNNLLLGMNHTYYMYMILIIAILLFCLVYIISSVYIMITSMSYCLIEDANNNSNDNNDYYDSYTNNNSIEDTNNIKKNMENAYVYNTEYNKISHIRVKFMKFLIEYHIYIVSYYVLIWCIYIIQYCINICNVYTNLSAFIILLTFAIIIIIADLVLCIMIMKYCTHILANNTAMLNLRNQYDIYLMIIFRIFIPFAYISIQHEDQDLIILTIITMFIVIRFLLIIFKCHTYYHSNQIKLITLFTGASLGVILAWIISKTLYYCENGQRSLMMSISILLFCPIVSKYIMNLQDNKINKAVHSSLDKLKDEKIIFKYSYFASIFIEGNVADEEEKKISITKILLKGKLIHHLNHCQNCKFTTDIRHIINNPLIFHLECYTRVRIHILQSILENGIRQNPRSIKLYLLLTEFIIDNDDGFHKGIIMIENIKGMRLLTRDELLSYNILRIRLMEKIKKFNQKRQFDFDPLLLCERLEQELIYKIKSQARHHLAFWNLLEEYNELDMDFLINLGIIIHNEFKDIERCWMNGESVYIKSLYLKPMLIYSIFLQVIKDNTHISEPILKKYSQFREKLNHLDKVYIISNHNISSEKNVFIRVNLNNTQLTDIFWCSKSINDLLGYTRQEILTKKQIEIIMPEFFKSSHARFVKDYFNTGKQKMLNMLKETYAQHKKGYLVPIYIFTTIYPHSIHGIYMSSIIRENQLPYEIILTSIEGDIISMTKNIMLDFQMNPEEFNKNMIWEICPSLRKVILAYQIIIKKQIDIKKQNETYRSNLKSIDDSYGHKEILDESIDMTNEKAQILVDKYSMNNNLICFEINRPKTSHISKINFEYTLLINIEIYSNHQCLLRLMLKKANEMIMYKDSLSKIRSSNNNNNNNKAEFSKYEFKSRNNKIFKSIKSINDIKSVDENPIESYRASINSGRCLVQKTILPKFEFTTEKNESIIDRNKGFIDKLELSLLGGTIGAGTGAIGGGVGATAVSGIGYQKQNNEFKKRKTVSFINQEEILDGVKELDIVQNHSWKETNHDDQSSTYSKSNEIKKAHRRVYQALEASYYSKLLQYQLRLIPLFLLATIGLMIGAEILSQSVSSLADRYVIITNKAYRRLMINVDLYRMSMIIWMIKNNFVDNIHFCYLNLTDCQNLLALPLDPIDQTTDFLLTNSTNIIKDMSDLDPGLQITFYNYQVKLCNVDVNGLLTNSCFTTDQFTSINAIHDKAKQISLFTLENLKQNNTDLTYILGNILGDMGQALQNTAFQISKNMKAVLGQVRLLLTNVLEFFVPLCGLIWIMIMITSMSMYIKNRRTLLNVARLPEKFTHLQVIKIKNFMKRLKHECHNDFDKLDLKANANRRLASTSTKLQSVFTRKTKMRKYCLWYIIRFGFFLLAIILIMLIFLLRLIYRTQSNQDRDIPLAAIDKSSKQMYYQGISIAYLYEYIAKNRSSTVMNQTISKALNSTLNLISSQQDFSTFFRFRDGEHDLNIDYVLFHNLCDILPQNITNYDYCTILSNGINERGLINLNTYAYQTISSIKDDFDKSKRSKTDMIKALNMQNIQDLQIISYSFMPYYYDYVYKLLYLRFKKATNDLINTGYIWIAVCTFCIIIIYWLILIPTMNSLLNEINNLKKVVKIIPKEYILSNTTLRKFVINTSNYEYHK